MKGIEDSIGELIVNEVTVNVEQTPTKITEEKRKHILDNAKLNVPEEFWQKYSVLLWTHHKVVSSNKYDIEECTRSLCNIELISED